MTIFRAGISSKLAFPFYLAFLVFALTQGPVYKIVFSDTQTSLKPDALAVAFSAFVLAQLPAVLSFCRTGSLTRLELNWDSRAILIVVSIVISSTAWSTARAATITASAAFALTAVSAMSVAERVSIRQLMWSVFIGVQPGLILSLYAVKQRWGGALEAKSSLEPWITTNNWVGIYGNRNSLAPVAAIGVLTSIFIVWDLARRRTRLAILSCLVIVVVSIFDVLMLVRSGSATLPFSILLATIVVCFSTMCRRVWQFKRSNRDTSYVSVAILGLVVLLSGFLLKLATNRYERLSGFDGRTTFWDAALDAWRSRPILGWGFMALWNTESFRASLPSSIAGATWGHSSYLDLLTAGGVLLALPVSMIVGVLLYRILVSRPYGVDGAWMAVVSMTILIASTQESFLLGSHFFLLLLIVNGMKLKKVPNSMRAVA